MACNKYNKNECPEDRCEVRKNANNKDKCMVKVDDNTDDDKEEKEMCFTDPCQTLEADECKKDDKCVFDTESSVCMVSPCSQKMDREGCGAVMMCAWVKVSMEMDADSKPEDEKDDSKDNARRFLGDDTTADDWENDVDNWGGDDVVCKNYDDKDLCQSKGCKWNGSKCKDKPEEDNTDNTDDVVCKNYEDKDLCQSNDCKWNGSKCKDKPEEDNTDVKSCADYNKNKCPEDKCVVKNKVCMDREDDGDDNRDDYGMCIVDNCYDKSKEDCQDGCAWGTKPSTEDKDKDGDKDTDGEGSNRRLLQDTKQCMVDGCPMLNKMDCGDSKTCNYDTEMKKCYYDECAMKSEDECMDKCEWKDDKPADDKPEDENVECKNYEDKDLCKSYEDKCQWKNSKCKDKPEEDNTDADEDTTEDMPCNTWNNNLAECPQDRCEVRPNANGKDKCMVPLDDNTDGNGRRFLADTTNEDTTDECDVGKSICKNQKSLVCDWDNKAELCSPKPADNADDNNTGSDGGDNTNDDTTDDMACNKYNKNECPEDRCEVKKNANNKDKCMVKDTTDDDKPADDDKPTGRCMRRMEEKDCDNEDCEDKNFSEGDKWSDDGDKWSDGN